MFFTQEEMDALQECIDTRSDEGFDTTVAVEVLKKIKTAMAEYDGSCPNCGGKEFYMNEQRTCVQCKTQTRVPYVG